MTKRRNARLAIAGPAFALALAACGGGTDEAVSTAPVAAAPADVEAPASPTEASETTEAPTAEAPAVADETAAPAEEAPTAEAPTAEASAEPVEAAASSRPAIQDLSAEEAIANAAANIDALAGGESLIDFEVLAVADGSAQTLRNVVTGDRPVLLWFFSPH